MKRKITAFLLAVTVMFSLVPDATAFARGEENNTSDTVEITGENIPAEEGDPSDDVENDAEIITEDKGEEENKESNEVPEENAEMKNTGIGEQRGGEEENTGIAALADTKATEYTADSAEALKDVITAISAQFEQTEFVITLQAY